MAKRPRHRSAGKEQLCRELDLGHTAIILPCAILDIRQRFSKKLKKYHHHHAAAAMPCPDCRRRHATAATAELVPRSVVAPSLEDGGGGAGPRAVLRHRRKGRAPAPRRRRSSMAELPLCLQHTEEPVAEAGAPALLAAAAAPRPAAPPHRSIYFGEG